MKEVRFYRQNDEYGYFSNFASLENLDLGSCNLTEFPATLINAKTLKIINLRMNKISDISTSLDSLPNLEELNLEFNKILTLSKIYSVTNSKLVFNLNSNKITSISPEFTANISELDLRDNKLTTIPEKFGSSSFISLNVSGNSIEVLPESIVTSRLQMLKADYNKLTSFPSSLSGSLVEFYGNGNNVTSLENIEDVSKFTKFVCNSNRLHPADLVRLYGVATTFGEILPQKMLNSAVDTLINVNEVSKQIVAQVRTDTSVVYQWFKGSSEEIPNETDKRLDLVESGTYSYKFVASDKVFDDYEQQSKWMSYVFDGGEFRVTIDETNAITPVAAPLSKNSKLLAYPNPASVADKEILFQVPAHLDGVAEITVYDNLGNSLDRQQLTVKGGETLSWDLRNRRGFKVGSGSYLAVLVVKSPNGKTFIEKLMVAIRN